MKKVLTVVGARPQFIKAAVVSRELEKKYDEIIVHTGQHYDYNMSDVFFEELNIPKPKYNLGISGGSHGSMTGNMIIQLESVMISEKPDLVLVYGDTNSTMAAAISAVKLNIPVVHVEAGNRLGTLKNPEEVNRIITDHISDINLFCTASAGEYLDKEGLSKKSFFIGDPMYDCYRYYSNIIGEKPTEKLFSIIDNEEIVLDEKFYYMTCHRQENTENINTLKEILDAMEELKHITIYPAHPRNKEMILTLFEKYKYKKVKVVNPVGYLMSIFLVNNCEKVVTDSGGLQREAFFARKQCITVFDYVVWPETMIANRNALAKPEKKDILSKINKEQIITDDKPFGNGDAGLKILTYIDEFFNSKE